MSFEIMRESGYNLDLDLLIILYQLRVLYPMRSGLVGKINLRIPIYLLVCLIIFLGEDHLVL